MSRVKQERQRVLGILNPRIGISDVTSASIITLFVKCSQSSWFAIKLLQNRWNKRVFIWYARKNFYSISLRTKNILR